MPCAAHKSCDRSRSFKGSWVNSRTECRRAIASSSDIRPSRIGAGNAMVSADLVFFSCRSSPVPEGMAQLPTSSSKVTASNVFLRTDCSSVPRRFPKKITTSVII